MSGKSLTLFLEKDLPLEKTDISDDLSLSSSRVDARADSLLQFLLTLFISVGIGLGVLTALAFSSLPAKNRYRVDLSLSLPGKEQTIRTISREIDVTFEQKRSNASQDLTNRIFSKFHIPAGANVTNINLTYRSTRRQCFADTSIISETVREILRHVSNKFFFASIGIVTILYTITFILALHRQNPRIRALKKSLYVLNKFDSYSSSHNHHNHHHPHPLAHLQQRNDSIISSHSPLRSSVATKPTLLQSKHLLIHAQQHNDSQLDLDHPDVFDDDPITTPGDSKAERNASRISISDATSDDLNAASERLQHMKQVSFQIQNNEDAQQQAHRAFLSSSFDEPFDRSNETYYKLPCPCSTTRQLLIKFQFAQPTLDLNQWLCFCCVKRPPSDDHQPSIAFSNEEETSIIITSTPPTHLNSSSSATNSETLRRQLHRHRIKQIRMASTFLFITVSFVLFYLPSILNAEQILTSPMWIYYLYLCTHALNPIIYCFMNISLRAYVFSMLKCRTKQRKRSITGGPATILDRSKIAENHYWHETRTFALLCMWHCAARALALDE